MTQIHEPGDVWHIGFEPTIQMWYVEPPLSVELDEPMEWFGDREAAFAFVDKWLREQPVIEPPPYVPPIPESPYVGPVAVAPPRTPSVGTYDPKGFVDRGLVDTEAMTEREIRLAHYNSKVGIK